MRPDRMGGAAPAGRRRAMEHYDQAVELDGNHAMARCRRGISHYYRKNYRQALDDLQAAAVVDPANPIIDTYVQAARAELRESE